MALSQMPAKTLGQEIARLKAAGVFPPPATSLANSTARVELPCPFDGFDATVHPDAARALVAVQAWADGAARGLARGLVLWSTGWGCGKTRLSAMAFDYLRQCSNPGAFGIRQPVRVSFVNAGDFYGAFRDAYALGRPEWPLFAEWTGGHMILDDFGKEHVKAESRAWAESKFYGVINRLFENKAFLMTSNLKPSAIEAAIGGASWSRLVGMCGADGFVNMSAVPDYRLRSATKGHA